MRFAAEAPSVPFTRSAARHRSPVPRPRSASPGADRSPAVTREPVSLVCRVMRTVIEVVGLRKSYRRLRGAPRLALDGLDLTVPEGGVFGLLGPNGSGKTTTIRCLLGLARPTGGACRLLGAEVPGGLRSVVGRVGTLVETPGLNPGMTARQILRVHARIAGVDR